MTSLDADRNPCRRRQLQMLTKYSIFECKVDMGSTNQTYARINECAFHVPASKVHVKATFRLRQRHMCVMFVCCQVFALVLLHLEYKTGVHTSGLQQFYWTIQLLVYIVKVRSISLQHDAVSHMTGVLCIFSTCNIHPEFERYKVGS